MLGWDTVLEDSRDEMPPGKGMVIRVVHHSEQGPLSVEDWPQDSHGY